MKNFKFNLEPIIKNYKFKEEQLILKLAEKEKCYQAEKFKLQDLENRIIQILKELEEKKLKNPEVEIIKLYEVYSERIKEKIRTQKNILSDLSKELNNIRYQLLKIVKNRKALEKFKEKKWNEFKFEMNRLEQKLFDEAAQIQFTRKTIGAE